MPNDSEPTRSSSPLASIPEALAALRAGRFAIVVDDEDRENEGDLVIAAEHCTPEAIAFMARHGMGLICVALTDERANALQLPLMVPVDRNETPHGTAFTVSVEARTGVTTGISAHDRARTVRLLADPTTTRVDLVTPGHIFPLRANPLGVLGRPGQTEASVDLPRLAGLQPAGVLCEIMREDGHMARLPDLVPFAQIHGLPIVSVADLIAYRLRHDSPVRRATETVLPTEYGVFKLLAYDSGPGREPELALTMGTVDDGQPVLTRLHSECLTGDALGSLRCDCGEQLRLAQARIGSEGRGVVLYLRQEGRGIGLLNKLRAYHLQDGGLDTVEANEHLGLPPDARQYAAAAAMLTDLGIRHVELMTNNPTKQDGLAALGITVVSRQPIQAPASEHNAAYLATKRQKMGHWLDGQPGRPARVGGPTDFDTLSA